jgi:hypothetical protein
MRWHTQNLSYDRLPTWRHGRCGAPTAPGSDCYCQHHLDTPASVSSDAAPQGGERCAHVPLGFEDDECSECEEKPVVAVLESGEQLCFVCFGKRFDEMAAKLTAERDRPLDPETVAGRFSGIGKLSSVVALASSGRDDAGAVTAEVERVADLVFELLATAVWPAPAEAPRTEELYRWAVYRGAALRHTVRTLGVESVHGRIAAEELRILAARSADALGRDG